MSTEAMVTVTYTEFSKMKEQLAELSAANSIREKEHKALARALIRYRDNRDYNLFHLLMREYAADDIELDSSFISDIGSNRFLDQLYK